MVDREKVLTWLTICGENSDCSGCCPYRTENSFTNSMKCMEALMRDALELLKQQPEIVRCKDCIHWDKTTRDEGNDCISGPWEDAVCEVFRDWDSYGELGEHFWRTNGDWFCADGERR